MRSCSGQKAVKTRERVRLRESDPTQRLALLPKSRCELFHHGAIRIESVPDGVRITSIRIQVGCVRRQLIDLTLEESRAIGRLLAEAAA